MVQLFCTTSDAVGPRYAVTSADGITWNLATTSLPFGIWFAVAWNGSVFCTIENGTQRTATSPDGITWTVHNTALPSSDQWVDITWNGTIFCAIAYNSTSGATSSDGITWTAQTLPGSAAEWNAVTWDGTVFCIVSQNAPGFGSQAQAATSPDGVAWTLQTIPATHTWNDVISNGSIICAIAQGGEVATSSNHGVAWSSGTLPATGGWWQALTWNGSIFCAVSSNNSNTAATSSDGLSWTQHNLPGSYSWQDIAWNGSIFAVTSINNIGGFSPVAISSDGISWSLNSMQAGSWFKIAAGPSTITPPSPGTYSSTLSSSTVSFADIPLASFTSSPSYGVVGSIVKLDGTRSSDPGGLDLTYTWSFLENGIPIGSKVAEEGFKNVGTDNSIVMFSPDVVGEYIVQLVVSNGVNDSELVSTRISIRAIMIPHARGIVPDGKFIWTYIRDVWTEVEGREWFETLWSALIQIVGVDMLKLYQNDFNKSIKDIQDLYQRRWLSYEPKLDLIPADLLLYIGSSCAGTDASTVRLGFEIQGIPISATEFLVSSSTIFPSIVGQSLTIKVALNSANLGTYLITGINKDKTGYLLASPIASPTSEITYAGMAFSFATQSTTWTVITGGGVESNLHPGDIIYYTAGPNKGFYKVLSRIGTSVVVDRPPPSLSTSNAFTANIYSPCQASISQNEVAELNTFQVPYSTTNDLSKVASNRIVSVNGRGFNIVRSLVNTRELTPLTVVTTDITIPTGLASMNWRVAHTITSLSQDFEALGVSNGDLLMVDLVEVTTGSVIPIKTQVVAVNGKSVSVVITDQDVTPGVVPSIPNEVYLDIANALQIGTVKENDDGTLSFSGVASDMHSEATSVAFASKYSNIQLTVFSKLDVGDYIFQLRPKHVLRNSKIPVDQDLKSIPVLQEYIKQPETTIIDDVVYQVRNGKNFPLPNFPEVLIENNDFTITDEVVYEGFMTFKPGSVTIDVDDGYFIDRGLVFGDSFIIESPASLAGTYTIKSVVSPNVLTLTRAIPSYSLSTYVTAKVKLQRRVSGNFIRFIPGAYTPIVLAPKRFWGEVSFFDNSQTVEDNFGILVGLTREDLDTASPGLNYRQAVAGVMYALAKGSAIDKVRLGIQILLGLPFTEHSGIIRSIDPTYRLDITGSAIFGRILVEDTDNDGNPSGIFRFYTYPIDDESSDLSGIETNPATGATYIEGDSVEAFSPLCKGVIVSDYVTDPGGVSSSYLKQLQQFQSMRIRINDSILNTADLNLISSFLKKITPSYISYTIQTSSEFEDNAAVLDSLIMRIRPESFSIVDNASWGVPGATYIDDKDFRSGTYHSSVDFAYKFAQKSGAGLSIAAGGNVTLPSGGFITANAGEVFQSPVIPTAQTSSTPDLTIKTGPNQGRYVLSSVTNTTATLTALDSSSYNGGLAAIVADASAEYSIETKINPLLAFGSGIKSVSGNDVRLAIDGAGNTPAYLRNCYVGPGDQLMQSSLPNVKTTIIAVKESTPGSGIWDTVTVTPTPTFGSGIITWFIWRRTFTPGQTLAFNAGITTGGIGSNLFTINNFFLASLLNVGDLLVTDTGLQYLVLDPIKGYATPAFTSAGTLNVAYQAKRTYFRSTTDFTTIFNLDYMDRDPDEFVELRLHNSSYGNVNWNGASATPSLSANTFSGIGVLPGDFIQIVGGTVVKLQDDGYGAGIFPIVSVGTTTVTTAHTNSGANDLAITDWKILRRR
jgi:hypothetical protein